MLGGLLLNRDAAEGAFSRLSVDSFSELKNQAVFNAIRMLWVLVQPIDAVSVAARLDQRGQLDGVGGEAYMHTLVASVSDADRVTEYVDMLARRSGV